MADENDNPRVVVDWVTLTAHVGTDPDTTTYQYVCQDNTAWHRLVGLTGYFMRRFENPELEDE